MALDPEYYYKSQLAACIKCGASRKAQAKSKLCRQCWDMVRSKNKFPASHKQAYHKEWRRLNWDQYRKSQLKWILKQGGCTPEQYETLLIEQGGACKICGKIPGHQGLSDTRLNVDHDHKTGKFRGLICNRCNKALGMVDDSIEILQKMQEYLWSIQNS